jgi:hypothetical protein
MNSTIIRPSDLIRILNISDFEPVIPIKTTNFNIKLALKVYIKTEKSVCRNISTVIRMKTVDHNCYVIDLL